MADNKKYSAQETIQVSNIVFYFVFVFLLFVADCVLFPASSKFYSQLFFICFFFVAFFYFGSTTDEVYENGIVWIDWKNWLSKQIMIQFDRLNAIKRLVGRVTDWTMQVLYVLLFLCNRLKSV